MRCFYFLAAIVLVSCSPKLALKKNSAITELGISVTYDQATPIPVQKSIEHNLDKFISVYNSDPRHLRLYRTENTDNAALSIRFLGTRLVTKGQQTAGVLVSLVGLSLPFIFVASGSDFYIFFYYFPRVLSTTQFSLSSDINASEVNPIQYGITSPGFLKSTERQIEKHGPYFGKHMKRVMKDIEKSRK